MIDIINADRIEGIKRLADESVHLAITSPPYNVGISYDKHNDNMHYDDYLDFLYITWRELWRVLVDGGRVCINIPSITFNGEYQPLFSDVILQMKRLGYIMRGDILWYKQNISNRTAWGSWKSPSNPCLVQPYEFVLVFSKKSKKLEGSKEKIDITKEEFVKFSNSFWQITPETKKKDHPVPFPEELVYRLIKFYSYVGNTVLDPFAGSGTVGVVAEKADRNSVLIEISRKYCDRIKKNFVQKPILFKK